MYMNDPLRIICTNFTDTITFQNASYLKVGRGHHGLLIPSVELSIFTFATLVFETGCDERGVDLTEKL